MIFCTPRLVWSDERREVCTEGETETIRLVDLKEMDGMGEGRHMHKGLRGLVYTKRGKNKGIIIDQSGKVFTVTGMKDDITVDRMET